MSQYLSLAKQIHVYHTDGVTTDINKLSEASLTANIQTASLFQPTGSEFKTDIRNSHSQTTIKLIKKLMMYSQNVRHITTPKDAQFPHRNNMSVLNCQFTYLNIVSTNY